MANEVLYSGISDARLSEALSMEADLVLADRFSLWGHPSLYYAGNAARSGSTTIKVPIPSLGGVDRMAGVAEGASVGNTALTLTSTTITIARQSLARSVSDLAELTDSNGAVNIEALVQDMVGAAAMRFQEMLCNVADDFTSTVGTTTVDMTVDNWFTAQFTLTQASASQQRMGLLFPTQLTDLQNSSRSETGTFEYRQDTQSFLEAKGQGFAGTFVGTPIVASSLVPTANSGADSAGALFAYGAIGYADGTPAPVRGAGEVVFPAGQRIFVEISRDARGALTDLVGNYYVGVSIMQDGKGVSIITDR